MGKILETKITRFGTGMVHDKRNPDFSAATLSKNFDILTYPHKLVPHLSKTDGISSASTKEIDNLIFTNSKLYGLGKDPTASGPENIQIYSSESFSSDDWVEVTNGQGDANPVDSFKELFLAYEYGGSKYIYGAYSSNMIWRYNITAASIDNSDHALTFTSIGQGLVHSKDDIMYVPYQTANGPRIAANNADSWTDVALTLPSGGYISSICEYGNFLAIAWSPSDLLSNTAKVYLWDRDSSLTTTSEKIDWGHGEIKVLEEVEGELVGVQQVSSTNIFNSQMIAKRYVGAGGAQEIAKVIGTTATCDIRLRKQKKNRRVYFLASITIDGTEHQGIWSLGKNDRGTFALSLEHTPNNDTALTGETLRGFFIAGDYAFITYDESGTFAMKKTQQSTYSQTATWQSTILDDEDETEDASVAKKLLGVAITTEPMPSAGSIIVKYRKNAESSYTTILTFTTDDAVGYSAINIESSGANLPEYNELQLQIVSTGGAVPTSLSFRREIIGKRKYD